MDKQFSITVKCLIYSEDKVLLLTKAKAEVKTDPYKNKWDLPGGRVEFAETPEDAIKREVFEEVSFHINNIEMKTTQTVVRKEWVHLLILFYETQVTNPDISLSDEHTAYTWFSLDELDKEPSIPAWIKKAVTT